MTFMHVTEVLAAPLTVLSLALGVPASPVYHSGYWLWVAALIALTLLLRDLARLRLLNRFYRAWGCIDSSD
jgi:hypothetical protein